MKQIRNFLFAGLLLLLLPLSALSGINTWSSGNGSGYVPLNTGLGNRIINALALTPDGQTVYAGNGSGSVFAYQYPVPAKLVVTSTPGSAVAGASFSVTVEVQDASGNLATTDSSTVTLAIQTNAGGGSLSGTLSTAAVNGVATFNGLSIDKAGTGYTLRATDGILTPGVSSAFTITAAAATHLSVTAPASANAGSAFSVTVTARDTYGNVATGYGGTVHFTTSGVSVAVPVDYAFVGGDNGAHTFTSGVTLMTTGSQTVTATDTVSGSITGSAGVTITLAAPVASAATAVTVTGFTANWGLVSGATSYYLDVATDSSFSSLVSGYNNRDVGNVTGLAVSGLSANTAYWYRVRANNANSTSADSNAINPSTGSSQVVTNNNDSGAGSLRQTLIDANPGDTITFAGTVTGSITLTSGVLPVSKDVTISGPGAAVLTVSGGGASQIFNVTGATGFSLQNLTLANGVAVGGGALVDNSASTTTITGCVFRDNSSSGPAANGGAIIVEGSMTISDSVFSGNSAAASDGGAIFNGAGLAVISDTLFSGNRADTGGAVANGNLMFLGNVTMNGNSATTAGGAIAALSGLTLQLGNTTLAGNTAPQGGGIFVAHATLLLKNSIVANNSAGGGGRDIFGLVTSQGYNLIGSTTDATIGGDPTGNITGTTTTPVNPLLGALADNGGTTQTMALLLGSPAIDAGTCSGAPVTDQRGMARPQNTLCDIGAYERGLPASVTATGGTPQSTLINTAFATALTAKVADSLGGALDGVSVAFTGPGSGAGIAAGGSSSTDGAGVASFSVSANGTSGSYTATASVNALTANFSLSNGLLSQSISFGSAPSLNYVGASGNVSASGGASGLPVTFTSTTPGVCSISGATVTSLATGTCSIAADQAGNGNYLPAPTATQNISIGVSTSYTGPSPTGSGSVTASFTGGGAGCGFAVSRFIALASVATPPPAGLAFPHGLFDFSTSGCTPGSTLAFTITYPLTLPSDTQYWKFGPTPGNATPHWYALPATISGASVRFNITDGGLGDDDLSRNGNIVDQGGPGVPGASAVTAIPTLSEWGMLMLTGLLALLGLRQMRRRGGRLPTKA